MMESLALFESVINSRWFRQTSIILFLNKIDVFKHKLTKVQPLSALFMAAAMWLMLITPNRYHWSSTSPNTQAALISTRLPSISSGNSCKQIGHSYVCTLSTLSSFCSFHFLLILVSLTQATDTTNIQLVFVVVEQTIRQYALKDCGIL